VANNNRPLETGNAIGKRLSNLSDERTQKHSRRDETGGCLFQVFESSNASFGNVASRSSYSKFCETTPLRFSRRQTGGPLIETGLKTELGPSSRSYCSIDEGIEIRLLQCKVPRYWHNSDMPP
jgi:hypothetical protein